METIRGVPYQCGIDPYPVLKCSSVAAFLLLITLPAPNRERSSSLKLDHACTLSDYGGELLNQARLPEAEHLQLLLREPPCSEPDTTTATAAPPRPLHSSTAPSSPPFAA